MIATIFIMLHSLLKSLLSRGRVYIPFSWIWESLWLRQKRHYVTFERSHKRWYNLCLVLLGHSILEHSHHVRKNPRPHERVHKFLADHSSLHQSPHLSADAFRVYQPPSHPSAFESFQLRPRHCGAETSCPHCSLSKFLTGRVLDLIQWLFCY